MWNTKFWVIGWVDVEALPWRDPWTKSPLPSPDKCSKTALAAGGHGRMCKIAAFFCSKHRKWKKTPLSARKRSSEINWEGKNAKKATLLFWKKPPNMQTEHEMGVILFAEKYHSRNSRESGWHGCLHQVTTQPGMPCSTLCMSPRCSKIAPYGFSNDKGELFSSFCL